MGANLFRSKTHNVDDKIGGLYIPARKHKEVKAKKNVLTRVELQHSLTDLSKEIDYTRCFNCGSKRKQTKWKLTHFCSLKCFGEWGYRSAVKYLYGDADLRYAEDFWREEGLIDC
jgi:hypothetical protein